MTLDLLRFLLIKSAGVGIGVFVGVLLGLGYRRRSSGKTDGLLAGSVALTALAVGAAAWVTMMVITWFGMR